MTKKAVLAPTKRQLRMVVAPKQEVITPRLSSKQMTDARDAVTALNLECVVISTKYNDMAIKTGQDARLSFDKAEVDRDRAALQRLFAEEYRFTDPFGVVGVRESTIENILAGKIRKDSFRATSDALQVHGNTIVSRGSFAMKGSVKVRLVESGRVRTRDIGGDYLTTHTYVKRDGRLQLAASQLTQIAKPKKFTHGPDEKGGPEL